MRAHTLDMTVGSPARLLLRFSLPLFVGNLLQQVYNLTDTAIAGHLLGDAALSQIGATAALYSLITTLAFSLNSGFALSVSRHFGANDRKRMEQSVCWMVTLSALCAAVMTAVFLLSRFALADAMQIPADTREGALAYLTVILAGIPLTMAYPDGAADGCGRHRAQRAARHEAYRRAVDLQHDGAGLQGVFQL